MAPTLVINPAEHKDETYRVINVVDGDTIDIAINNKKQRVRLIGVNTPETVHEARFDEYVRGGIDVLYEKLIEGGGEPEDYVKRLYDFLEDIQERYNAGVDIDTLMKLCVS